MAQKNQYSKAEIKKIVETQFGLNYKEWESELLNNAVYDLVMSKMLKEEKTTQSHQKGGEL